MDTPSFFHTNRKNAFSQKEVEESIQLLHPGPHAIIFIQKVGWFVQSDRYTIQMVKDLFRNEGKHFLILLFTHKDRLENNSMVTLTEYLEKQQDRDFQELVGMCGKTRCLAFNNKVEGEEMHQQVRELLAMIDALVRQNGAKSCYTHQIFKRDSANCTIS